MKKLFFNLFSGILITGILLISCSSDDNSGSDNPGGGSATLSASHYGFDGGNAGAFNSTQAGIAKTSAAGMTILTISGIRNGGTESINIVLYGDVTAPKTYTLGGGSTDGIVIRKDYQNVTDLSKSYSTDNDGTGGMTGGGEVRITSITGNQIEGTFYAICHNSSGQEAFAEQGTFSGTMN